MALLSNEEILDGRGNTASVRIPCSESGAPVTRLINGSTVAGPGISVKCVHQPITACSDGQAPVARLVNAADVVDGKTDRSSSARFRRRNEFSGSVSSNVIPSPSTTTNTMCSDAPINLPIMASEPIPAGIVPSPERRATARDRSTEFGISTEGRNRVPVSKLARSRSTSFVGMGRDSIVATGIIVIATGRGSDQTVI